ncbi:MAG: hypothetical protein ACE3L7_15885 [Candidatus Pristimantibacillus sp.]
MKKLFLFSLICMVFAGCSSNNTKDYDDSEVVLEQYIQAITDHDSNELVRLYGGSYDWLVQFSPEENKDNKQKLIENYLKTIPQNLQLNEIVEKKEVSKDEYVYVITFKQEDGNLFEVREADLKKSEFTYTVKKIDQQFKIMEVPPYQP